MKLAKIFNPLINLKGYTMWNIDEQHEIMYFYYRIKTKRGMLRLFLYLFLNEKFSGVEYIAENDCKIDEELLDIIRPYKEIAELVLKKRDRLRDLFH